MHFPESRAALYSRLKRPGPWVSLLVLLGLSYFGWSYSGEPWRWWKAAEVTFFLALSILLQPFAWQWSGDERLRPSFGRGWLQAWAFWGSILFLLKLSTWQGLFHHPLKFFAASFLVTLLLGPIGYLIARWEQHASEARKAKALAQETTWMRHRGAFSPTLLFNQLDYLAELAAQDPKAAERGVLELADLYRSWLQKAELPLIPWASEREMTEQFLALEARRLGVPLRVEWPSAPKLESTWIPPFSIFSLLEGLLVDQKSPLSLDISLGEAGIVILRSRIEDWERTLRIPEMGRQA